VLPNIVQWGQFLPSLWYRGIVLVIWDCYLMLDSLERHFQRLRLFNVQITPGNTDDRKPVPDLVQSLFGKIFADRGYVSQALATKLLQDFGIQFFAKPRRNMKNHLMLLSDKLLARKRSIIETVIDQLKNISQIEHSRHRSPVNFGVNILCGLIAYCYQPKKPSLNLERDLPRSA
jgi:hypothetical protein